MVLRASCNIWQHMKTIPIIRFGGQGVAPCMWYDKICGQEDRIRS
jgi:hypothetical protein